MENSTIIGWVPEPDTRGTFGILKSCVITLALCIYTALHLNVPRRDATTTYLIWRKTVWVLIGMFCPELVVFFAWDQLQQAKHLEKQLEAVFRQQEEKGSGAKRRYKWTRVHSFYALMGGFVIDTDVDGEDAYVPDSPRLTMSIDMVSDAARLEILPDIPEEDIKDKSKADGFAKLLAIAQASWFIMQTVMRWATMPPVTALEINTIAHAVCALVIYMLWWNKPLDIQYPTPMTDEKAHMLTALYWELGTIADLSNFKEKKDPRHLGFETPFKCDLKQSRFLDKVAICGCIAIVSKEVPKPYHFMRFRMGNTSRV
ncbi:unnamed protein product [Clonostachys rosea]|uniref:Uncharacterized protein n=1 Tax=Bionectria ochroleuca TaxID=29856 RepID=A0ABY6U8S9_BIOOC|nr:unnamed protein product [Clonostachys rosea]